MERWQLKMLCAAVALVISVVCSFLPFFFIYINCQKIKEKFGTKTQNKNESNSKNQTNVELESRISNKDVNANYPLPSLQENPEENQNTDQSIHKVENESSELETKFLGCLMCFGGGVFLGTFLLHMLPEVVELMDEYVLSPNGITYRLTHLLVGVGFFMILIAEASVGACQNFKAKRSRKLQTSPGKVDDNDQEASISDVYLDEAAIVEDVEHSRGTITRKQNDIIIDHHHHNDYENHDHHHHNDDDSQICHHHHSEDGPSHHHHHHSEDGPSHHHHHHSEDSHTHHHHHQHHEDGHSHHHHHHHSTRSIALVLALSLHHIFEGLSIGLQKYFNDVWHLTVAVLCHEVAICFSMGLQFYKDDRNLSKKVFVILLIAASIMPLGIVIGIAISETNTDGEVAYWQNILNGVLQAIACGIFLYVTFFEILCPEMSDGNIKALKIFSIVLGFTLMALLGLIPEQGAAEVVLEDSLNMTTLTYLDTTI